MKIKILFATMMALIVALVILLNAMDSGLYVAYMLLMGGWVPLLILLGVVSVVLGVLCARGKSTKAVWITIFLLEATVILMGLVALLSRNEAESFMTYCCVVTYTAYTIAQIFLGIIIQGCCEPDAKIAEEESCGKLEN